MSQSVHPAICYVNALESLRKLVSRLGDTNRSEWLISSARAQQDQAVFWLPRNKLLVAEYPIEGMSLIRELTGLNGEVAVVSRYNNSSFAEAVIRDSSVIEHIRRYIGNAKSIEMFAHTNTESFFRFADHLASVLSIDVLFPEASRGLDLRDQIDRKSGLRELFREICGVDGVCRIPQGVEVEDVEEAALSVLNLTNQGRQAIVKADIGEASIGLEIFDCHTSFEVIVEKISASPYYGSDPIVVEELITGDNIRFPSIELHVPGNGSTPELLHICDMLFEGRTNLKGNVTSKDLYKSKWSLPFVDAALKIASDIQSKGYIGHFGIDAVTDRHNNIYLLDLNSRRTGSSHVHDFGVSFWGRNYIDKICIGNYDFSGLPSSFTSNALFDLLSGLTADPRKSACGVVPAELSGLEFGHFGSLIFAPDRAKFNNLVAAVKERLRIFADNSLVE
ncbi:MAG: hypothetical protein CPSOU_6697 [uncultured Paraburkholderia sp.]|nr:MAG: hypothetical protein CPSOU_6697 [uncultured Paraburkholderia sp.]